MLKTAQWKNKNTFDTKALTTFNNNFQFSPYGNFGSNLKWHGATSKASSEPEFINYTVKAGDNLSLIGKRHNMSLNDLKEYNQFKNENIINTGQVIKIPTKTGLKNKQASNTNAPLFPNNPDERLNWQNNINKLPSNQVVDEYERKTGKKPYITINQDRGELYVINPATKDTVYRAPALIGTGNNNPYYGNSSSSLRNDDRFPEKDFKRNNNLTGEGVYKTDGKFDQHAGSAYGKFTVALKDQRGKDGTHPGMLFHQATSPDRFVKLDKLRQLQKEGKPIPPDLVCGSNGCINLETKTMDELSNIFGNNFSGINTYVLPRANNKNSAIKIKDGFPTMERLGNNWTATSDTTKATIDLNTFTRKGSKIDIKRKSGDPTVQAGIGNNLLEFDKNSDEFYRGMNAASDSLQTHYGLSNDEVAKIKATSAGIANAETKMGTDYSRFGGLIDKKDAHEQKGLMGMFGVTNQNLAAGKKMVDQTKKYFGKRGTIGGVMDAVGNAFSDIWDAGTTFATNALAKGEFNFDGSRLSNKVKQLKKNLDTMPVTPSHGITQVKYMPTNPSALNYLKRDFNITKPEDSYNPFNSGALTFASMAENYTNLKTNTKNATTRKNQGVTPFKPLNTQNLFKLTPYKFPFSNINENNNVKGWDRLVRTPEFNNSTLFDYLPYTWQNPKELAKGTATPSKNNYIKKVRDFRTNIGFSERS